MYPGPWQLDSVDSSSTWCFAPPLPVGGMMVLGGRELARFDFGLAGRKARTWRIVIPARKLIGFSPMADARCLVIADESGIIYHLQMDVEACEFSVLFRLDAMRPSCITALKCDYYFIGSVLDGGLLGRVHIDLLGNLDHFEIAQCLCGPFERQGLCGPPEHSITSTNSTFVQISVTVSGTTFATPSSIRPSNVWILRLQKQLTVIVSAKHTTSTFIIDSDGLVTRKANPVGFEECAQTICCCNLGHSAVQVTDRTVFFLMPRKDTVWQPGLSRIVTASGNGQILLLSLTNRRMVILNENMEVIASELLLCDVSCLATSPFNSPAFAAVGRVLAAAAWSTSGVSVFNQKLSECHRLPVLCCAHPRHSRTPLFVRAMSFVDLSQAPYLFCALSNGLVVIFALARGIEGQMLTTKTRVVNVGVLPAQLSASKTVILCKSDRACFVYGDGRAPLFESAIASTKPHHSSDWSPYIVMPINNAEKTFMVMICHKEITLSRLDYEHTLNEAISCLGHEGTRRDCAYSKALYRRSVCHNKHNQLLTFHLPPYRESPGTFRYGWGEAPLNICCQARLLSLEYPLCCSIVPLEFSQGVVTRRSGFFIAVGTAFAEDELEPHAGRLIVFQDPASSHSSISLITACELKGAVYSIASTCSHLVCTVNHAVEVYQDTGTGDLRLQLKASFNGLVAAVRIICHHGLILVADVTSSVTLLKFDDKKTDLVEVACFNRADWASRLGKANDPFCIKESSTEHTIVKPRPGVSLGRFRLGLSGCVCGSIKRATLLNDDMSRVLGHLRLLLLDLLASTAGALSHAIWRPRT